MNRPARVGPALEADMATAQARFLCKLPFWSCPALSCRFESDPRLELRSSPKRICSGLRSKVGECKAACMKAMNAMPAMKAIPATNGRDLRRQQAKLVYCGLNIGVSLLLARAQYRSFITPGSPSNEHYTELLYCWHRYDAHVG